VDVGIPGGAHAFPEHTKAWYTVDQREMLSAEYSIHNLVPNLSNLSSMFGNKIFARNCFVSADSKNSPGGKSAASEAHQHFANDSRC